MAAERRAGETADLVRELVVPALLRAAGDLGWWSASAAPGSGGGGLFVVAPGMAPERSAGRPELLDVVDPGTWAALRLVPRTLHPADAGAGHRLIEAALASDDAVTVSAAVVDGWVVGAVISAVVADARRILGVGVAPAWRQDGLAGELLGRHFAAGSAHEPWEAIATVAERDPYDPLPRARRASIARRLLEGAGFIVERPPGPVGMADPAALIGHRG